MAISKRALPPALSLDAFVEEVLDYAIFGLDPDGIILSWNKGAERIKGWTQSEMVGQSFERLYPAEDLRAGKPARELGVARTEGRFEEEGWRVRKDGSRFWANVLIAAVRDAEGVLQGFTKVTRDLTAHRAAEDGARRLAVETAAREAAEASEARLRFLAEAGSELGRSLDPLATLAHVARLSVPLLADWTTVAVRQEGTMRRIAVVHRDPDRADAVHAYESAFPPEQHVDGPIYRRLLGGQPVVVAEMSEAELRTWAQSDAHLTVLRRLGVASCMLVPFVSRGRTLGVLSLVRAEPGRPYGPADLALAVELAHRAALAVENAELFTAERQARTEAQAHAARLAEALRQREALAAELREAVDLRDRFLSVASHELKTPLTPMLLRLTVLARQLPGAPDDAFGRAVRDYVAVAGRQISKLNALVRDLLDVSRIGAGRFPFELDEVDVTALVRECVERLEPEAERAGSCVRVRADGPIAVTTDGSRLEQVLVNLLENAVKYGAGKPVEVEVRRAGQGVEVRVRDAGIGVAPEHQTRIFERFERAVSGRNYGGLGLGLYIARSILDSLGGSIAVASAPGEGATFTVSLPDRPPPAAVPPTRT